MPGYKNFAVAGAGGLGNFIIDELLRKKAAGNVHKIVVLTRSMQGKDALAAKGVEPIVVDYNSPDALWSALQGVDVVISTVAGRSGPVLTVQEPLAEAAKAAGVKLFVPSEFGGDTINHKDGPLAAKNAQHDKLTQLGLPWALFFTGMFSDYFWNQPFLGFDLNNGKVEVAGMGSGLVSWTSRKDIARYVVYATTSLPPSKLHNHVFKIEGERTSVKKVVAEYEVRTGEKVHITCIPMDEVKKKAASGDFKSLLQLVFELDGTYGREEEMNVDWPDFNPETVVDAMVSSKA
ncbi:NAD-P-binding protein [Calocera viscosa TUFC12733]|uniref:NAD-P-binding protein n=1 Tax=Calocera viscosa (strain TUFC12733) TaxID=1330018 RepID=A0A167JBS0_CALVF|nr:NAD-P-binding protein [Calocera viscosa TUFC12733]